MSRSTRSASALLLAALLAGCGDTTVLEPMAAPSSGPSRIINGTFDSNSLYPAVGALAFDYRQNGLTGDDEWCTGSLISPTVFLTAAHCVITRYTPPGSQFYVSFAPDLYAKNAKFIPAVTYYADPQYGHDQANLHDLAVIILPEGSTKGLTPYRLPTRGELDALSAQGGLNNAIFINVGYGVSATRTGVPDFPYDGKRSYSESEFMGLQPYWLGLLMNENATGLGGDCYGDSGGPKFLKTNPGVVYATVTTGDYVCRATSWDYRTDTDDARAFLGQFVTLR
ncbi:MAG TPA: trypsin-like serine protease [Gemmatimonadaceae bacterium]|nr:trypsin-like serine protease [Gemmatimonadaceae bacterium]